MEFYFMAGTAHIFINGIIGEPDFFDFSENNMGNTLPDVRRQFNSYDNPDSVVVHIDSMGGEVNAGLAIYDYLIALPLPTTTIIEGKAFSIASTFVLAGNPGKRLARPHSEILIHNPWIQFANGDANDLEKMAIELRKREETLLNLYADKTGITRETLAEWMDNETYLDANEAIAAGFIDGIEQTIIARIEEYHKKPLRAVAFININREKMTDDQKKATGIISEIKNLLGIVKNQEPEKVEEPEETPAAENEANEWEREKATMQAQIEALEAKLSEKENEANEATKETEKKIEEQAAVIAAITEKVKALEAMPVIQGNPKEVVVNNQEEPGHYKMYADAARRIRNEYGGVK